jgi:MFS family permease
MSAPSLKYPHLAMIVIGLGELIATLDHFIVNVALPSAPADLSFDDSLRSWVISVYALAFGGLLPLGGALVGRLGWR